jgi:hypothetical protein
MECVRYSPTPDNVPPMGPGDRENTTAPSGTFHVAGDEPHAGSSMAAALATLVVAMLVEITNAAPSAIDAMLLERVAEPANVDVPLSMDRAVPTDESCSMVTSCRGVRTRPLTSFITFRLSQLKEQFMLSSSRSSTAEYL